MTSTPGSDAERGLEAEERHEQARQQGAEEEYDAVHGTDRGVHAPLDAVGRGRLPVRDVIRVFDAHREAVDELRDRDDDQHDGDAGVGGERREREHEPRDHDQDSAEKDRLAGAEPHADTGRDHRTDEAADAPGREGDAERPRGESQLTKDEDGEDGHDDAVAEEPHVHRERERPQGRMLVRVPHSLGDVVSRVASRRALLGLRLVDVDARLQDGGDGINHRLESEEYRRTNDVEQHAAQRWAGRSCDGAALPDA